MGGVENFAKFLSVVTSWWACPNRKGASDGAIYHVYYQTFNAPNRSNTSSRQVPRDDGALELYPEAIPPAMTIRTIILPVTVLQEQHRRTPCPRDQGL